MQVYSVQPQIGDVNILNNADKLRKHIIELMKADVLLAYHVVMPPNDTGYDKVGCN